MSKKKYDHTMSDIKRPGRYEGDYLAALDYDPMFEGRKKWLVTVGHWNVIRYSEKAKREGYVDREYWADTSGIFWDGFESKRFRTSERAIAYLLKVRAAADAGVIRKRLSEAKSGQRSRIS